MARLEQLIADLASHTDTADLASSLVDIEAVLASHWSTVYLQWFTDHGPRHSKNVAEYALRLADVPSINPALRLTPIESYILAAAALLHDIGMNDLELCPRPLGAMTVDDFDNVRHEHPRRSSDLLMQDPRRWRLPTDVTLAEVVGLVARAHGTSHYLPTLPLLSQRTRVRNKPVRGELLAALLLLADELDLHYERETVLPGGAKLGPVSEAHAFKHRCVVSTEVEPDDNGTIKISLTISPPGSLDDALADEVQSWIVEKLWRQIGLTEPAIDSGFAKQVRVSRSIAVKRQEALAPKPTPSDKALAVIRAENAEHAVLDHREALVTAKRALSAGQAVFVTGRWSIERQMDLDGREDVLQAIITSMRSHPSGTVLTSNRLRLTGAGEASDVVEEWLLSIVEQVPQLASSERQRRRQLLTLLVGAVREWASNYQKSEQRLIASASCLDCLDNQSREWLLGMAVPALVEAAKDSLAFVGTTSADVAPASIPGRVCVTVPSENLEIEQLRSDLSSYGDVGFVDPLCDTDLEYSTLKRIAIQASQSLVAEAAQ